MKPETVSLGEACIVVMGQSPPRTSYNTSGDGLPFFQGKTDFGEISPKVRVFCNQPSRIAEEGDILMSVRAPVGPTNLAKEKCCIGRGLAALRAGARLDARFLLYFLRHHEPRLASQGQGSTFDAVNRDDLQEIEIPLPGLSEQRRIAGRLEQADRLRRTRRLVLEHTQTFLPAAFLELFGDPKQNPSKWPRQYLSAVCSRFSDGPFGSNLKSSHYRSSGVRVVRLQNIGVGEFLDDDKAFISKEHFATLQKHACLPGDVLIGTMGDPNLRACIQPDDVPIAVNKADCIQARPDPKHLNAFYLQMLLNMPSALYLVPGMIHGQTRARVSMGELAELPIPVPRLQLQQNFAALAERVERLRSVQREALRQAEHLFASLLHIAFSD